MSSLSGVSAGSTVRFRLGSFPGVDLLGVVRHVSTVEGVASPVTVHFKAPDGTRRSANLRLTDVRVAW